MTKEELDFHKKYITELNTVLNVEPIDSKKLVNLLIRIDTVYGDDDDRIRDCFEYIKQTPEMVYDYSCAIRDVLELEYRQSFRIYAEGIMPITHEKLSICPSAQKNYEAAIEKYNSGLYERNIVDDMRLSLELVLKKVLNNNSSLENQRSQLGNYLEQKGYTAEIRNLVEKTISGYSSYQNQNVKHNDRVHSGEIKYIIEQTSAVMNFLIDVYQGDE